jgi:RNA polymerase sigma-70 factor (ECF subfamily)
MDGSILSLLQNRNESALEELTRQYGSLLKGLARRLLPSKEDADECVNDALLDVWNTIPPQHPSSISSYACMLTRRRAIDRVRYLSAQKRGSGVYLVALDELEECIPDGTTLDGEESSLTEALNGFLETLSPKDRQIFMGRYFGFETIEELAHKNKTNKNTVNIRLSRTRVKLKSYLLERGISV